MADKKDKVVKINEDNLVDLINKAKKLEIV